MVYSSRYSHKFRRDTVQGYSSRIKIENSVHLLTLFDNLDSVPDYSRRIPFSRDVPTLEVYRVNSRDANM